MEVVTARVLYSKDPAHKKRKRWKDGFFLGKRTKEGKVNLKLLDENGAPLCSRSGLKYENEEDLQQGLAASGPEIADVLDGLAALVRPDVS